MKRKSPLREMADMHDSYINNESCADDKKEIFKAGEDDELLDFELELEVDDEAQVHSIDGVIIEGNNEVARLLFYYFKPKRINIEEEVVKCRCIAEFRVSRSALKEIVKDINDNIQHAKRNLGRKSHNMYQEKLSMYS